MQSASLESAVLMERRPTRSALRGTAVSELQASCNLGGSRFPIGCNSVLPERIQQQWHAVSCQTQFGGPMQAPRAWHRMEELRRADGIRLHAFLQPSLTSTAMRPRHSVL